MPEPIRVAHVMGKMVGGGLEAVVMNYYRHIDRSKVQFDFIVDEDSTLVPREEIESLGGRVFTVPPYQRVVAYQRALVRLFREQGWEIVQSHENALSVFPLCAAKRAGVPVRIAHSHSTAGPGEPARNAVKWVLRRFANVYPTHRMACSRHAGEWLFGKRADFEILYNAIELDRFLFDSRVRAETRDELGIPEGALVIGHIGRFVAQKNQGFLLEAFNRVMQDGTSSVLVLAGDGPLRSEMEGRAKSLGIAGSVRFLGQRDDANRLYQAFDVFCLPSLYEGLGIVAVEAQAAGLSCLLSIEVPREADVTGAVRFLPIDDVRAWADALAEAENGVRIKARRDDFVDYDIEQAAKRVGEWYLGLASSSSLSTHRSALGRKPAPADAETMRESEG